ncbi:uncharacterized protein TEOVI_000195900 [Trypanosoma equiperdum]|uniref:Uncharacterized protein n=1 Tax=Trypanosoma equiperdum TaxID=5694 RepID=A0A1G4IDT7_TRYEQ|nr:hypothetical protein, conserved [Trypanosoma equiperdum]
MMRSLSKEDLLFLARQAVSGVRRAMSFPQLGAQSQQKILFSTLETLEDCFRRQASIDLRTVDLWVTSFSEELVSQLNCCSGTTAEHAEYGGNGSHPAHRQGDAPYILSTPSAPGTRGDKQRDVGESALIGCARLLSELLQRIGEGAAKVFSQRGIVTHMMKFFVHVPLSKKMRQAFSTALADVMGYNAALLGEGVSASRSLLLKCSEEGRVFSVVPQQVHLVSVLAAAISRGEYGARQEEVSLFQRDGDAFLSDLICTCSALAGDATGEQDIRGIRLTGCLAYFDLLKVVLRSCAESKAMCRSRHREKFMAAWVRTASSLHNLRLEMEMPTSNPGGSAGPIIGSEETWVFVLVDVLVEVAATNSFSRSRETFFGSLKCHGTIADSVIYPKTSSLAATFSSLAPSMSYLAVVRPTGRAVESFPSFWETLMTGESSGVWQLASLLFDCVLTGDGCSLVAEALLCVNSGGDITDCIYRYVIFTLALLCTAAPQNAKVLAEGPVIDALLACIASNEESVFSCAESPSVLSCTIHPLSARSIEASVALLNLLTSLHANERVMKRLMDGVGKMCSQRVLAADVNIVESFLHVLGCTSFPRGALYFSGASCIRCSLDWDRFGSLFSTYTCVSWLHPKCVWREGSPLFCCEYAQCGVSVTLVIVANGRLCGLVVRFRIFEEVTNVKVPGVSFQADTWSHVVFTQHPAGFTVCVNGCRAEVRFPHDTYEAVSKEKVVKISLGGVLGVPSFFGFAASMELLDRALTMEEVMKLYDLGPKSLSEAAASCYLPLNVLCGVSFGEDVPIIKVVDEIRQRPQNLSVSNLTTFLPPNMGEIFAHHDVAGWAVRTVAGAGAAAESFPVVARLCVRFLCTTMKLSTIDGGIDRIIDGGVIERLRGALLSWRHLPVDVPALLISCTIPRGGKIMRNHDTTQSILSLMLDLVDRGGLGPHDASCLLRELSDTLLFPENVAIFRLVPGRFERLLNMSVSLPLECVGNLIVLVERLCKEPREIEQVLKFLLIEAVSKTHERVKAVVLHMLFDIARTDTTVCDLIESAFDNTGASFLILLAGGKSHGSEVIRVLALRILSLMLHSREDSHKKFINSRGYEVLAAVMAGPEAACVPIGMATFNCLFQMAFGAFLPAASGGLERARQIRTASLGSRRDNLPHEVAGVSTTEKRLHVVGSQGYLPCLIHQPLRMARREYGFGSFCEGSGGDCSQYQLCEVHELSRVRAYSEGVLREPQVIYPLLRLLERLLQNMNNHMEESCEDILDAAVVTGEFTFAVSGQGNVQRGSSFTGIPSSSSVCGERESPAVVALRVLTYIEKIVGCPKSSEMLLTFPWLTLLWDSIQHVMASPTSRSSYTGEGLLASQRPRIFAGIEKRIRRAATRLAIRDLGCNSSAGVVRDIVQGRHPTIFRRIILEDIASHFALNHHGFSNRAEAMNIVQNLDLLFRSIEDILSPPPVPLVLSIVNCINAIAVRNDSWVRMRMREYSRLFETRDHLSYLLLTTTEAFGKLKPVALRQVLEANENRPRTIRILLFHLGNAVTRGDTVEVGVLLLMIWHLNKVDKSNIHALHSIVGEEYARFVDNVCLRMDTTLSRAPVVAEGASAYPCVMREATTNAYSDDAAMALVREVSASVVEWHREDSDRWKVVQQRLVAAPECVGSGSVGSEEDAFGCSSDMTGVNCAVQSSSNWKIEILGHLERIKREVNTRVTESC